MSSGGQAHTGFAYERRDRFARRGEFGRRLMEADMRTAILLAVLHGVVSIPPIRVFQPYPDVKCPRGYAIWWPSGKEFDNDRYAECMKPVHARTTKSNTTMKEVSLRQKNVQQRHIP